MSRALGSVLLMMFGGHGGSREQDLRERPEQEETGVAEQSAPVPREAAMAPLHPRLFGPFAGKLCQGR